MPKKITQTEIKNTLLWLTTDMTVADLARKIKMNPRHIGVYTRVALVVRKLVKEGKITINQ